MNRVKIVSINLGNYGSTGAIVQGISELATKEGYLVFNAYPSCKANRPAKSNDIVIGKTFFNRVCAKIAYYKGTHSIFSTFLTQIFIFKIKKSKPDIIHLHNTHTSIIDSKILFRYIKKNRIKTVWTFHDCWPFTGHCPHFVMAKCDQWRDGCKHCPQYRQYPASFYDNSKKMWKRKKEWFSGVENMTIVTPSRWLADLVKQSFLKDYPVKVINNGIDLSVFKPVVSDFRTKYSIPESKFMILGVAFGWGARKGLDIFIELAGRLPKEQYQIVLVGTNDEIDKVLTDDIISIHRTTSQQELAEIYSTADLFLNPTREDTYPTVNMEALACGTPVLTFYTGGSPEILDESTGSVVHCDDVDALENEIIRICNDAPYSKEVCMKRATAFDMNDKFKEYIRLYKELLNDRTTE